MEISKFYISHTQYNGLRKHKEIRKYSPIQLTDTWQKENMSFKIIFSAIQRILIQDTLIQNL